MEGTVIHGFGRGSKELGIPTANLPLDNSQALTWIAEIERGAYFGWASLRLQAASPVQANHQHTATLTTPSMLADSSGFTIYPMVMSIGYNPHFKNESPSAEVHLLYNFDADFYGADMRLLILGFIRPERKYPSTEALINDIKMDVEVARRSLAREAWSLRELGMGMLDGSWLVRATEENIGGGTLTYIWKTPPGRCAQNLM
ncbi:hypothetical protein BD413DRAFT_572615 [Trametes elegans]|nr:hypothetical protein BD413DRAFT_572615 [Trametes elegans]